MLIQISTIPTSPRMLYVTIWYILIFSPLLNSVVNTVQLWIYHHSKYLLPLHKHTRSLTHLPLSYALQSNCAWTFIRFQNNQFPLSSTLQGLALLLLRLEISVGGQRHWAWGEKMSGSVLFSLRLSLLCVKARSWYLCWQQCSGHWLWSERCGANVLRPWRRRMNSWTKVKEAGWVKWTRQYWMVLCLKVVSN